MEIAIVGTGYVGLVAATCFAEAGHKLVCVDSNREKIDTLKSGKAPFFEPGLDELLAKNLKRMTFVHEISEIPGSCSVVFIAVGTPERPDGSADMEPTFRGLQQVCEVTTGPRVVVLKSTVPIGTAEKASAYASEHCSHPVEIVSNPEFLRQGSALKDFLNPDRVVIGCKTEKTAATMRELYGSFLKDQKRFFAMDNTSAEMVKYAANSFLAL